MSALVREVEKTGISTAVIAPRLFQENLLLPIIIEPVKEENTLRYPLRPDCAVSWCSHLDIADVAAGLFADTSVTGIVGVGQLPAVTGNDLAAAFSAHLGRKVVFEALQPEECGNMLAPFIGEEAVAGVAAAYKAKAQTTDAAIDNETSAQRLLGTTPRTVEQWLHEIGI